METLRQIQIVCRHGARANHFIRESYPSDVNCEELAQLGIGQLTKKGRIQMFELGKYLRERYNFFLKDDVRSIYARSSDYDRCIDSANCVLTGMFPPNDPLNQVDPNLNWQPVPVHTESFENDKVLYNIKVTGHVRQVSLQKLPPHVEEHKKKIEEATQMTLESMFYLGPVCDQILLEVASQMSVPPAILTVIPEAKEVMKYYQDFMTAGELTREFGGGLLNCLREKIESVGNQVEEDHPLPAKHHPRKPKAFLYLTSDFVIFPVMKLLGIVEDLPNFGVTLILEVHEIQGKLIVRIFYNNDTINDPTKFKSHKIPLATQYDCPIEEFIKLTQ